MSADSPQVIAANVAALAAASGLPPEAIDAAARQIAHYIDGTERDLWPDPDLEDVLWAAEALKAAAPMIAAAERAWIRALAVEAGARYRVPRPCGCADVSCNASRYVDRPFADMLASLEPTRAADSTTEV